MLSIIYEFNENGTNFYRCKCSCGNYTTVKKNNYSEFDVCGECPTITEKLRIKNFVVQKKLSPNKWECKCICGRNVEIEENELIHGQTSSCGCCKTINRYNPALSYLIFKYNEEYPNKYSENNTILDLIPEVNS